jgi:hypothetical protein
MLYVKRQWMGHSICEHERPETRQVILMAYFSTRVVKSMCTAVIYHTRGKGRSVCVDSRATLMSTKRNVIETADSASYYDPYTAFSRLSFCAFQTLSQVNK